ncbi:xanthine dehydrogenase accessory factor [Meinhardsimonia xiamenensis]|jgi:xanthine dehydrogenase accessory factor|uniref:Xanthine dehydrogenase accessory factor n=1 Tax=Meinhardsimonia xiamenensis TaxID=990712 RepID=A0A1G9EEV4_9RHOB|nr:xanthine dehydrogenase accessory protein XdhC [Meinhardsimonia xiamenensis]PRX33799.1 xanthine dehydrogenase accessory factor [Meinhardsimonia xiamenensis]SDK74644.1 xanthine dehydrogenase accessory factor [Meinhardsimonia xiamenensis]
MSFDRAALERAIARHGPVARVLVADVAGSAPREAGAAMLVWEGGQEGTIGGGALEFEAVAAARAALAAGRAAFVSRVPLGPALGQCCGGAVTLVTEVWDEARLAALGAGAALRRVEGASAEPPLALARLAARARSEGAAAPTRLEGGWLIEPLAAPVRQLWVWGAGHVGRAIVQVMAPLPDVAITWIDTAQERFPETIPEGVTMLVAATPAPAVAAAPRQAEHLILTYSHALDLEICHLLLGHGFAAAGLIGSASKWARFRARLASLGHGPEAIARIRCPIGRPELGKHPQAIAVGVAAEFLAAPPAAAAREGAA